MPTALQLARNYLKLRGANSCLRLKVLRSMLPIMADKILLAQQMHVHEA